MRISKTCLSCKGSFEIPPCRDHREHCCSSACKRAHAAALRAESIARRTRECLECKKPFVARQTQIDNGQGKFCSIACGLEFNRDLLNSVENQVKRAEGLRAAVKDGRITFRYGPANPTWKGGREASNERLKPKRATYTREYRKRNPHKVKEFSQRRKNGKTGRLPRGFVAKLFALQKGKCPICRCSIADGYHVDHITAISKGGAHSPGNIQLLCPACNVRKSAKDPIDYMQSRGYLL